MFVLLSTNVAAIEDKIVAVVNKNPITLSSLEERKKIMHYFGNVPKNLSKDQEKMFTMQVLNSLIDEEVLSQYAKKYNIKVADQEIKNFIKHIEISNKIPEGQLEKTSLNLHISKAAFLDKMRAEVLRSKIINEVISQQVNVTKNDVDSLILDTNSRDANLSLRIFTSKNNNDRAYKSMNKLAGRIKNCDHLNRLRYHSFANLTEVETTLSAIDPKLQGLLKDMSIGEATGVIKEDNEMKIFLLCGRQIEAFSDNDANQVFQIVANRQLGTKARKFLQNLRKKAYVKIMI